MKKAIFLLIVWLFSFNNALAVNTWSPTSENKYRNWEIYNYVDDFKQETDVQYITNYYSISGTFCNSAVQDRKLKVEWAIDLEDVTLFLYEYGDNLVTSYSSYTTNYDVTMRDSSGQDTKLTAQLFSNGDRLHFSEKSANSIKEAFSKGGKVSFYLQNRKRSVETYLFTINDTSGFAEAWAELSNITIIDGIEVTAKSFEVRLRNKDGSVILSIWEGEKFVITGYDPTCQMFTATHEGKTGYVKGTGLSISKDELLNLCNSK